MALQACTVQKVSARVRGAEGLGNQIGATVSKDVFWLSVLLGPVLNGERITTAEIFRLFLLSSTAGVCEAVCQGLLLLGCLTPNKAGVCKMDRMGDHLVAWLDCTSPCNGCFCHIQPCPRAACSNNTGYKYLGGLGEEGTFLALPWGNTGPSGRDQPISPCLWQTGG